MPKGYWVGSLAIKDQAKYDAYRALNGEAFHKYGGRFLVRGGGFDTMFGTTKYPRQIVIEFPTYQAAWDCFHSPEYKRAVEARGDDGVDIDLIVVEGYDGPQP
jgi:uncharacterized protein (DUF1330 family)